MPDAPAPTRAELRACAARELGYRRSVYPHLVSKGRMRAAEAAHETRCQEALVDLLAALGDAPLPPAPQPDLFASPPV